VAREVSGSESTGDFGKDAIDAGDNEDSERDAGGVDTGDDGDPELEVDEAG